MINPFNPGFNNISPSRITRASLQNKLLKQADQLQTGFWPYLIDGLRGSGKTVFLNDLGDAMFDRQNWIAVDLEPSDNFISTLTSTIYYQADTDICEELDMLDYDDPTEMLIKYVAIINKHRLKLFIAIDDVNQPTQELLKLFKICDQLGKQANTIMLIWACITSQLKHFFDDEDFAQLVRQSQRITLPLLSIQDVRQQYQTLFSQGHRVIETTALNYMAEATKGYPYAFQILGSLIWETNQLKITDKIVNDILPRYRQILFQGVYQHIREELTIGEREVIEIIAHETSSVVDEATLKWQIVNTSSAAENCLPQLIDNQIVKRPAPGKITFTLPYFKEFAIQNETQFIDSELF